MHFDRRNASNVFRLAASTQMTKDNEWRQAVMSGLLNEANAAPELEGTGASVGYAVGSTSLFVVFINTSICKLYWLYLRAPSLIKHSVQTFISNVDNCYYLARRHVFYDALGLGRRASVVLGPRSL